MPQPVAATESLEELLFPRGGIDLSQAFSRQLARKGPDGEYQKTTPEAHNVRVYDPDQGRGRGGSRGGLAKWIDQRVGGKTWVVQELATLTTAGFTPGDATVQSSTTGRVVTVIAVVQGRLYTANPGDTAWSSTTNATGENPPLNYSGVLFSATNGQKLFFCDGQNYRYFDPLTNTVYNWAATTGDLPEDEDNNFATLICTWRCRTVLSGLLKDPNNVFMSRISAPFDWNYGVDPPDPGRAIAFGASEGLGLIGDRVTCLIPFSDDVLYIGGDSSIFRIQGDPNDGGKVDLVTTAIGMTWGQPWCRGPDGAVYFFSNRCSIHRLAPGMQPEQLSRPIDSLLKQINTGEYHVRMAWSPEEEGFWVLVTKLAETAATTHYFWEARTGAWTTNNFANKNHNPLACCTLDGNRPEDRVVLFGSWDGYVRTVSPTAEKDDGSAISSSVTIGPLLTPDLDEVMVKDIQAVMGEESEDVTFAVHVGTTAEKALDTDAVETGTLTAGRNPVSFVRRSGHAVYVKLSSTKRWAMESIRARVATQGKVRRRGF